ncbi:hypothetical protein HV824_10170 [Myxococcus sp. AM009]|uniref:hypothetical protein n=1 Tax=unclassified Myxococcus TaxID=2648731 RepID=UPI001595EFF5|nr:MULTISPECIES: hypothetical protein [unclassified Myxococcus]NVI98488.1 hypothetical protein [Myxococcus sp. AM009]NVJ14044.1 hypothetical protein [Myxococcus sp. AM010]
MPILSKPWLIFLVTGPLAAFLAGWHAAPDANAQVLQELEHQSGMLESLVKQTALPSNAPCGPPPPPASVDVALLRAELALALREALPPSHASARADAAEAPEEASPQSLSAVQEIHRLIDAAIRARRWTVEDAQAFRESLGIMPPAHRNDAIRRLITTINSQALEVQTEGAPF